MTCVSLASESGIRLPGEQEEKALHHYPRRGVIEMTDQPQRGSTDWARKLRAGNQTLILPIDFGAQIRRYGVGLQWANEHRGKKGQSFVLQRN